MIVVGLTGGIATGKSTVAIMFEELGAHRIDTDQLARRVVEPGQPAWEAIVNTFGRDILDAENRLDRKKLGSIVFADPAKREQLNRLTHPAVRECLHGELDSARADGALVALVEVPLLYEAGFEREVEFVVVVVVSETTQLNRLMDREKLSRAEALQRMEAQMPLVEKIERADYVINNEGDLQATRRQVAEVWQQLRREHRND